MLRISFEFMQISIQHCLIDHKIQCVLLYFEVNIFILGPQSKDIGTTKLQENAGARESGALKTSNQNSVWKAGPPGIARQTVWEDHGLSK